MPLTYPDGTDLLNYIASLGIVDEEVKDARFGALDLTVKAGAAAAEWERRTAWRPFLAQAGQSRRFDAPWAARTLELSGGLLSLTTLTVDDDARTLDEDFWLGPENAAAKGLPYTFVEFAGRAVASARRGIEITGDWGRMETLTDDIWQAVLHYGACLCYPELSLGISKGAYSIRDVNFEIRYAGAGNGPLFLEAQTWKSVFDAAVRRYKRVSL